MPTLELTKKRQRWVQQFKPTAVVRGLPMHYPAAVGQYYVSAMLALLDDVQDEFQRKIIRLFKSPLGREHFATDDSIESQTRILINKLTKELDKFSDKQAKKIAKRFTRNLDSTNASMMYKSFEELSGGTRLKTSTITESIREQLKNAINVNSGLIKSIITSSIGQMSDAVYRSIMTGRGLADLTPFFEKHNEISKRHARNVALDQTRKAYTALTRTRMTSAGLGKFEWRHSGGGQEPRKYHKDNWPLGLNRGIFDINDPPVIDKKTGEKGLPGQAINCKCIMVPVLDFSDGVES